MPLLPDDVAEAIKRIDEVAVGWPPDLMAAWRAVRGYARRRTSDSQGALSAISRAAQEVVQTRNHAQAALDAMAGVFGGQTAQLEPIEPETKPHRIVKDSDER